jgi:hypothetical protein
LESKGENLLAELGAVAGGFRQACREAFEGRFRLLDRRFRGESE